MPRVVTIIKTLYQFDELPTAAAKEKARDWYRELAASDDLLELCLDDFESIAKILGVEFDTREIHSARTGRTRYEKRVYYSGFSSQGDGASFDGRYSYVADAPKKIREYAPQDAILHAIADDLESLQNKYGKQLYAKTNVSGHYVHANCMAVDVACADDGDYGINADSLIIDDEKELTQILRRFANWIYRQLEQAYDYNMSDESVDENIRINEYEFNETGKRDHD